MSKTEITPELLADLKDKAKKATQGIWDGILLFGEYENYVCPDAWIDEGNSVAICRYAYDAKYIGAANPSVILALIERIEWLEREYAYSMRFSY